ncbi:MAG TPA: type I phosphomannose isomerase catalytic subunit [Ilumatobacter sp.]|nr:type I phosphomannose isomerase catalytic subunit [Ilumatobacter sp.]
MQRVEGVIQHYAWGDTDFIPRLLGLQPDGRPWAELWLGTHPSGPTVLQGGSPLIELTGSLPYLLKVLAAGEPLSMQTHPDAAQAQDGFERGIFPTPDAKPELLVALTPFEALCGVRPVEATLALLHELGDDQPATEQLARVLASDGPGSALEALYRGGLDTGAVIESCQASDRPEAVWVRRLSDRYPGDPSVAATLLLNYVALEPGQALRFDAGNLHSYLRGAGIELMGASDNVVRGGLTVKPVDVDELFRIVDPTPLQDPVLSGDRRFELPAAGVALIRVDAGETHSATIHELAISLDGTTLYLAPGDELLAEHATYVVTSL